jgi:hypothetical protein
MAMSGHDFKAYLTQGAPICEAFAARAVHQLALGAMVAHGVVRHPLGLLNRLIERAKVGQFVPNRSLSGSQSMLASDKNLSRPAVDASAAKPTSQPRSASDIAMQALSHLRSKWDPETK